MTDDDPRPVGRLPELGRWYEEWALKHEASTPFRPDVHPEDDDYNLYYVYMEAGPEAFDELMTRGRQVTGLDPETGMPHSGTRDRGSAARALFAEFGACTCGRQVRGVSPADFGATDRSPDAAPTEPALLRPAKRPRGWPTDANCALAAWVEEPMVQAVACQSAAYFAVVSWRSEAR